MREIHTAKKGVTFQVNADDISGWAEVRHRIDQQNGNEYTVHDLSDPSESIGSLRYISNFPRPGIITIHALHVRPEYQGRGVGIELLARLHADNPGHQIDPGAPSPEGIEFIARIMEIEPQVRVAASLLHPSVQHLLDS